MPQDGNAATAPVHDAGRGGVALLVIDMINSFDFVGADALKPKAVEAVESILRLRAAAERAGWPVIYINDNFGEWHSEKSRLVERARDGGKEVVDRLQPDDSSYFIIKPQFSGFYATNLPVLLPKLGVSRLILTGIQTDICVLFTAADAHMRDYQLWIPEDGVAAEEDERSRWALEIMRASMGAETRPTTELDAEGWLAQLS
jgi:nicotinamidase-related amidase